LDFAVFAFQSVPPAPGRVGSPVTTQLPDKAPSGSDSAPATPGGGAFGMLFPLLLVGMLVFIFWSSRSQQKKQDAAVSDLKKGDRVVTQSGMIGRLVDLEPRYAKLEIAPGVKIQVLRTSLSGRDADDKKDKDEPSSEKK
jgi:preprotein translocase subunit YajC